MKLFKVKLNLYEKHIGVIGLQFVFISQLWLKIKAKHRREYQHTSSQNTYLTLNNVDVKFKINVCITSELLI